MLSRPLVKYPPRRLRSRRAGLSSPALPIACRKVAQWTGSLPVPRQSGGDLPYSRRPTNPNNNPATASSQLFTTNNPSAVVHQGTQLPCSTSWHGSSGVGFDAGGDTSGAGGGVGGAGFGDGGPGGNGRGVAGDSGREDDDSGGDGLAPPRNLLLCVTAAVLAASSLAALHPAPAIANVTAEAASVANAFGTGVAAAAGTGSTAGPTGTGSGMASTQQVGQGASQQSSTAEDTLRFKRLLREAFGELTDLRARMDAADAAVEDAAAAAAEAWVVPMEGLSVRPYARRLAADMMLRSRAQVSGSVDTTVVAPLAASERMPVADAVAATDLNPVEAPSRTAAGSPIAPAAVPPTPPAEGITDGWDGMLRAAGIRPVGSPRLRLRIQSIWGNSTTAASASAPGAAVASAGAAGGAAAAGDSGDTVEDVTVLGGQGRSRGRRGLAGRAQQQRRRGSGSGEGVVEEEQRPVAAHLQLQTGPDGRSLVIDKLLLKAEAHPRLKLLLATHGSLDNIGMNANPFAGGGELQRGLTRATRRGHDLTLLSRGGTGLGASAKAGSMAAAVGAFAAANTTAISGHDDTRRPLDDTNAPAAAAAAATMTLCGQVSLHRTRRFVLTAACAASTSADAPPCATGDGGERRELQRGLIGAMLCGDRVSASAWVGDATISRIPAQTTPYGSGGGSSNRTSRGGSDDDGPLGTWADARSEPANDIAAAAAHVLSRQRRVGMRLATLPDEETGRSFALSVSHRSWRAGAAGGEGGGRPAGARGTSQGGSLLVAEASASLPVTHGVVLTPGLLLLVGGGRGIGGDGGAIGNRGVGGSTMVSGRRRMMLCTTAQTTWSF